MVSSYVTILMSFGFQVNVSRTSSPVEATVLSKLETTILDFIPISEKKFDGPAPLVVPRDVEPLFTLLETKLSKKLMNTVTDQY